MVQDKYLPGADFPTTMGACVDLYAEIKALRLEMEKEIEPFKKREAELREYMIANIAKSRDEGGDTGAAGKFYRVQIRDKAAIKVTDWKELHAFIAENNRFDLLQKRANDKAVLELLQDYIVPGVEEMLLPDISVTKI